MTAWRGRNPSSVIKRVTFELGTGVFRVSTWVGQLLQRKARVTRKRMKYFGSDDNFVMVGREWVK